MSGRESAASCPLPVPLRSCIPYFRSWKSFEQVNGIAGESQTTRIRKAV